MATTVKEQEEKVQNRRFFDATSSIPNPPEYGNIVEAKQMPTEDGQGGFTVRVRFDKYPSETFWMGMAYPVDVISMLFGDEDSLVNRRCRVEYYGARPQDGLVFIVHDKNFRGDMTKARKVRHFGSVFCPAG